MSSEFQNRKIEGESQAPKLVRLGEEFYPFQLPIEKWHDYSLHFSMNPATHSTVVLETGFLPNLRFHSIIQPEKPRGRSGQLWVEADKGDLDGFGMLVPSWNAPDDILLPMPPAVYGGSRWSGYYILNNEVLEAMKKLRAHLFLPEGEYIASPNVFSKTRPSTSFQYAKGIEFDQFTKANEDPKNKYDIMVDLRDKTYLKGIKAKFTFLV